ncbi:MAG: GC-type dockerin domain-anchored protein [Phycisphaerales bacterium]
MKTSLAALALLANLAHAQTILDLGLLPNSNRSQATSMSADGSVVFGNSDGGTALLKAFRWTQATGIQQIPSIQISDQTNANRCSDSGNALGGGVWRQQGNANIMGFGWTSTGGTFDLPLNGTLGPVECQGVTRFGNYYFGRVRQPSGAMHAFRWSPTAGFHMLGVLPANSFNSIAYDANQDGSVVAGSCDLFGVTNASRWTAATGQQLLGPMPGTSTTYATRVNRGGDVILGYGLGSNGSRAFRWSQSTGLVELPAAAGFPVTFAAAVSDDGDLILGSSTNPQANFTVGTVWLPSTGIFSLNTFFSSLGLNLSGWTLTGGAAISTDLTTIAGSGVLNGAARAFRISGIPCWTPPELLVNLPRSFAVCQGQQIDLNVLGGGTHAINVYYHWELNGVPLWDGLQPSGAVVYGAQSPNFTITGATAAESGVYSCTLFNPCGTIYSSATNVTVHSAPVWQALDAPVEVCPGGTASLNAQVFSSLPVSYQWEYLDPVVGWWPVPSGLFADFFNGLFVLTSGTNTQTLSLSSVYLGSYEPLRFRCVVQNTCGTAPLRGISTPVSHASPLSVSGNPSDLTKCAAGPANFSFGVVGSGSPAYDWQTYSYFWNGWVSLGTGVYVDGFNGITFTAAGVSTPNLVITNAYLANHEGTLLFRCIANGPCNSVVSSTAQLTVCVGDFNCDGNTDGDDIIDFFAMWDNGDPAADVTQDGNVDGDDLIVFFGGWDAGC